MVSLLSALLPTVPVAGLAAAGRGVADPAAPVDFGALLAIAPADGFAIPLDRDAVARQPLAAPGSDLPAATLPDGAPPSPFMPAGTAPAPEQPVVSTRALLMAQLAPGRPMSPTSTGILVPAPRAPRIDVALAPEVATPRPAPADEVVPTEEPRVAPPAPVTPNTIVADAPGRADDDPIVLADRDEDMPSRPPVMRHDTGAPPAPIAAPLPPAAGDEPREPAGPVAPDDAVKDALVSTPARPGRPSPEAVPVRASARAASRPSSDVPIAPTDASAPRGGSAVATPVRPPRPAVGQAAVPAPPSPVGAAPADLPSPTAPTIATSSATPMATPDPRADVLTAAGLSEPPSPLPTRGQAATSASPAPPAEVRAPAPAQMVETTVAAVATPPQTAWSGAPRPAAGDAPTSPDAPVAAGRSPPPPRREPSTVAAVAAILAPSPAEPKRSVARIAATPARATATAGAAPPPEASQGRPGRSLDVAVPASAAPASPPPATSTAVAPARAIAPAENAPSTDAASPPAPLAPTPSTSTRPAQVISPAQAGPVTGAAPNLVPVAAPPVAATTSGGDRVAPPTAEEPAPRAAAPRAEPAFRAFATAMFDAVAPVAPAAPIAEAAPIDLTRPHWPHAMVDRIERLRDEASLGDTRIRLVPDALGTIDVALRRDGDTVHVAFRAEQAETRQLLAEARPELAALAEARGIRIADAAAAPAPAAPAAPAGSWSGTAANPGQTFAGNDRAPGRQHPPSTPAAPRRAAVAAEASGDDTRIA